MDISYWTKEQVETIQKERFQKLQLKNDTMFKAILRFFRKLFGKVKDEVKDAEKKAKERIEDETDKL